MKSGQKKLICMVNRIAMESVETKPLVVCPCFAVNETLDNPLRVDKLHASIRHLVYQTLGDISQLRHHHSITQFCSWK